jgi:hypothetical protein
MTCDNELQLISDRIVVVIKTLPASIYFEIFNNTNHQHFSSHGDGATPDIDHNTAYYSTTADDLQQSTN